jgi:hypothetical protein
MEDHLDKAFVYFGLEDIDFQRVAVTEVSLLSAYDTMMDGLPGTDVNFYPTIYSIYGTISDLSLCMLELCL